MKKTMLTAACIAAFTLVLNFSGKAQLTSGTTTLNVAIVDVLSITVTPGPVLLSFLLPTDYENGVNITMPAHLIVTSNQAYDLNVKTGTATLVGTVTPANSIAASTVSVDLPTGQNLGGTSLAVSSLSTTNQQILDEGSPATLKTINVKYSIPSSVSTTTAILGKPTDIYQTTVTYTISVD